MSIFAGRNLIMRYTAHEDVDECLRRGFVPTTVLGGTHHGAWSVMMAWGFCDCPLPSLAGLPVAPLGTGGAA